MPDVQSGLLPGRGQSSFMQTGENRDSRPMAFFNYGKRRNRPEGPKPLKKPLGPANPVSFSAIHDRGSRGRLIGS
jgi:hypothetical protein